MHSGKKKDPPSNLYKKMTENVKSDKNSPGPSFIYSEPGGADELGNVRDRADEGISPGDLAESL